MKKIFLIIAITLFCFINIGFCADKVVVIPLMDKEYVVGPEGPPGPEIMFRDEWGQEFKGVLMYKEYHFAAPDDTITQFWINPVDICPDCVPPIRFIFVTVGSHYHSSVVVSVIVESANKIRVTVNAHGIGNFAQITINILYLLDD